MGSSLGLDLEISICNINYLNRMYGGVWLCDVSSKLYLPFQSWVIESIGACEAISGSSSAMWCCSSTFYYKLLSHDRLAGGHVFKGTASHRWRWGGRDTSHAPMASKQDSEKVNTIFLSLIFIIDRVSELCIYYVLL